MELPRRAQKWLYLDMELVDAHGNAVTGAGFEASFDGGLTWIDGDTSDGSPRWMLRGPLYNPNEAGMPAPPNGITPVTIPASSTFEARAIAAPEVETYTGKIYLV